LSPSNVRGRWKAAAPLLAAAALLASALALRGADAADPDAPAGSGRTRAAQAWDEVRFLNYAGAAKIFASLRRAAPAGSEQRREATMGLAVCLHYRQPDTEADKTGAAGLYDELIADAGDADSGGHRYRPLALLLRARLADQVDFRGDRPDPRTAEGLYVRLMREYPEDVLAHEAAIYLAQLRIHSGDPETAARGAGALQVWAELHRGNPLEALQWMEVADAWCRPFENPHQAVAALLEAESAGLPAGVKRDVFLWRLACLARRAGYDAVARDCFERIVREEPRSPLCHAAQQHVEELGGTPPPLRDPFEEWDEPAESGGGAAAP
jgi:hypothetical protein